MNNSVSSVAPDKKKKKQTFAFPQKIGRFRTGPDMGVLLWRIINVQAEVQDGRLKLLKQSFFRCWRESEDNFSEYSDRLTTNIADLVKRSGRSHLENFTAFAMKVATQFRREQLLLQDPAQRMSHDILFQTIQLLSLNPTREEAQQVMQNIGVHYSGSNITALDREILQRNFHAYQFLARKIIALKSLRQALDLRDELIAVTAKNHPHVMVYNLDCMLRFIVAQFLLARKFRCDTLIVEWMKEYGFGPEQMILIAKYVPYEASFLKFHAHYRKGIQDLKNYAPASSEAQDSDEYLLRSLSIFYTSWVMKTSEQLTAG